MSWYDRDYARDEGDARPFGGRPGASAPSLVTTLIVINVAVFAFNRYGGEWGRALWLLGAMQVEAVLHGQVWRLFTSQYLHSISGFGHILFNMIALHFFGRDLEQVWGRRKLFAVYTMSGLAGNLFLMVLAMTEPNLRLMPAVGASGCLLGLLGASAVLFPSQVIYLNFLFPIRIRTAALLFAGFYALNIFRQGANYGGDACHLAGLGFGAWWTWAGQSWWAGLRGAGRAPRAQATGFRRRVQQRVEDARLIDHLLAKVHERGVQSLTFAERRALEEATERQRQQEAQSGRVDRL